MTYPSESIDTPKTRNPNHERQETRHASPEENQSADFLTTLATGSDYDIFQLEDVTAPPTPHTPHTPPSAFTTSSEQTNHDTPVSLSPWDLNDLCNRHEKSGPRNLAHCPRAFAQHLLSTVGGSNSAYTSPQKPYTTSNREIQSAEKPKKTQPVGIFAPKSSVNRNLFNTGPTDPIAIPGTKRQLHFCR